MAKTEPRKRTSTRPPKGSALSHIVPKKTAPLGPKGESDPVKRATGFQPGHAKVGGRQKGTPNIISRKVHELVILAAHESGDQKGRGGVIGYLKWLSKRDTQSFTRLMERSMNQQIAAADGGIVDMREFKTQKEIIDAMREQGLPIPPSLDDRLANIRDVTPTSKPKKVEGEIIPPSKKN